MLPFVFADASKMGIVQPFGLLVAIGMGSTDWLCARRVVLVGLSLPAFRSLRVWVLACGFLISHILDEMVCHPATILRDPLSLLELWNGLSSAGGLIGAAVGGVLWKYLTFERRRLFVLPTLREAPLPLFRYADVVLAIFPVGWVFGRAGCAIVHDHPGALAASDALFAVAWPTSPEDGVHHVLGPVHAVWGSVPRYDLGLLEMLFTIVLALACILTWRRRLPVGTYIALTSLAYAPVRFAMDFLRIQDETNSDPRFLLLTFAQWCSLALFVFGLVVVARVRGGRANVDAKRSGFGAERGLGVE